jgi:hypothetical protein
MLTPLRFIDTPKIHTVTGFGDRIILANSSYVYTISTIRIGTLEQLVEMLDARLRSYNKLARELSEPA